MTNIGTTRSSVAYLIEVLVKIVRDLEEGLAEDEPGAAGRARPRGAEADQPVRAAAGLQRFPPGLPRPAAATPEGDVRRAFFLSYDDTTCEYWPDHAAQRLHNGQPVVSATFVTPYPPGLPVLVPGQLFSPQILEFMRSLDTPEVHGYDPQAGYRVDTAKALETAQEEQG